MDGELSSATQRSSFQRSDVSFDSGLRGLRDGASWVERLSNGSGQAHFVQLDAFEAANPASILH
ncbi:MAG: hypothetical protein ACFCGT_00565 [Sandaracinaceae bacterium]